MASSTVLSVLESIGLRNLVENFKKQKILDIETCKQLSDNDLAQLGLCTIGDRARFRAEIKAETKACTSTIPANEGLLVQQYYIFIPPPPTFIGGGGR